LLDDTSMVKIMETLGLNFNPAELAIKSFEGRVASLNLQLSQMKMNAIAGARDINQSFSSQLGSMGAGTTILNQFGQPLKTIQTEATKTTTSVKKVVDQFNNSKIKDDPNNIFASGFQRRAEWFLSGSLFFGLINGAKAATKTISDVEMGVTEIARVMEDTNFVFNDFRDNLLGLGVDYGQTFDKVQDITLRWAQAGYNVRDSIELTKTSLLALNTAELDAATSTKAFVGIMSQWGLTAGDLPLVLDKINKTADDFVVESQDLVDGLLRSSGAARIMGMSLEQTISLLTVMKEASGRTGREVGKHVAPCKSNLAGKLALNSGKVQRWTIVSQAA